MPLCRSACARCAFSESRKIRQFHCFVRRGTYLIVTLCYIAYHSPEQCILAEDTVAKSPRCSSTPCLSLHCPVHMQVHCIIASRLEAIALRLHMQVQGTRMLLGAPGLTTRSKNATRSLCLCCLGSSSLPLHPAARSLRGVESMQGAGLDYEATRRKTT